MNPDGIAQAQACATNRVSAERLWEKKEEKENWQCQLVALEDANSAAERG